MEVKQWAGLVTNASPYILPPGAAAVQENLNCRTPGQLQVRDGMRLLTFGTGTGFESVSIYPYSFNGVTKLVALAANGTVSVLSAPTFPPPPVVPIVPTDPALSPSAGQVVSSYTGRFYDYDQEAPA